MTCHDGRALFTVRSVGVENVITRLQCTGVDREGARALARRGNPRPLPSIDLIEDASNRRPGEIVRSSYCKRRRQGGCLVAGKRLNRGRNGNRLHLLLGDRHHVVAELIGDVRLIRDRVNRYAVGLFAGAEGCDEIRRSIDHGYVIASIHGCGVRHVNLVGHGIHSDVKRARANSEERRIVRRSVDNHDAVAVFIGEIDLVCDGVYRNGKRLDASRNRRGLVGNSVDDGDSARSRVIIEI